VFGDGRCKVGVVVVMVVNVGRCVFARGTHAHECMIAGLIDSCCWFVHR